VGDNSVADYVCALLPFGKSPILKRIPLEFGHQLKTLATSKMKKQQNKNTRLTLKNILNK